MSKKLETLETKAREAKTANGFVSAMQKYAAIGGSADVIEKILNSVSLKLSTGHLLSVLYFHSLTNGSINAFGETIWQKIAKTADFNEKITLASIVSEFKDRDLGATIAEEAFLEIEGTDDYYFRALSGLADVVLNTSIDSLDGNGRAPLTVGGKEYKISTVQSILDDVLAAKDGFSKEEHASNLIKISRCAYMAGDAEMGDRIYKDAILVIQDTSEIDVIFYEVGSISIPGVSVLEPLEEVEFPSAEVRDELILLAKKKMKGDELENALSYFS